VSTTPDESKAVALVKKIVTVGIDGAGPVSSAQKVAEEHRSHHPDVEVAIRRLIATHTRLVAASGFATGFGGFATMPVSLPADLASFYVLSARCVGSIAHLRGYDLESEEVRSVVLLSLLGAGGTKVASEFGVKLGTKSATAAIGRIPGRVLIEINKQVGFRLITRACQKGVINLGKIVPVVGAGVGAGVNATGMRTIGVYAKKNFPTVQPAQPPAD
jgi:hypothetical protein